MLPITNFFIGGFGDCTAIITNINVHIRQIADNMRSCKVFRGLKINANDPPRG